MYMHTLNYSTMQYLDTFFSVLLTIAGICLYYCMLICTYVLIKVYSVCYSLSNKFIFHQIDVQILYAEWKKPGLIILIV